VGLAGDAHLLVGALSHSGAWRAVLAESEDQPHLIAGLGQLTDRLGGLTKRWRFDRMATVCHPGTGTVTASFAAVAKHYGVGVDICSSRHGHGKGTVEKGNHSLAQRWWRTVGEDATPVTAQPGVDAFCLRADARIRARDGHRTTVGALAGAEVLNPAPGVAFPAVATVTRTVSAQALVAFEGNSYSIGSGMSGASVLVSHRLGAPTLDITTAAGTVLACHHRHPAGGGMISRHETHVTALERAVLAEFSTATTCARKQRRPASPAALADAAALHSSVGLTPARAGSTVESGVDPALLRDSPRSRGEHPSAVKNLYQFVDSPPLARENVNGSSEIAFTADSPPLARGARDGYPRGLVAARLTPARAGSTPYRRRPIRMRRTHPRSRGEHPD